MGPEALETLVVGIILSICEPSQSRYTTLCALILVAAVHDVAVYLVSKFFPSQPFNISLSRVQKSFHIYCTFVHWCAANDELFKIASYIK